MTVSEGSYGTVSYSNYSLLLLIAKPSEVNLVNYWLEFTGLVGTVKFRQIKKCYLL